MVVRVVKKLFSVIIQTIDQAQNKLFLILIETFLRKHKKTFIRSRGSIPNLNTPSKLLFHSLNDIFSTEVILRCLKLMIWIA
jgi:hypothetical protein